MGKLLIFGAEQKLCNGSALDDENDADEEGYQSAGPEAPEDAPGETDWGMVHLEQTRSESRETPD
jgi:hypothetical protein